MFHIFRLILLCIGLASTAALAASRIVGSSTIYPVAQDVAVHFAQDAKIDLIVGGGGSDAGLAAVRAGKADVGMVSRVLRSDEKEGLQATMIGLDGIALIVHQRNPLLNLMHAEAQALFSGRVTEWRDLGLAKEGRVIPVIKSPGRATRTVFDTYFGIGPLVPSNAVELGSNLAILLYVSSDPDAIGYVSIGTLEEAARRGLKVRGIKLDSAPPSLAACSNGSYSLCRPLFMVTRGAVKSETRAFLDYLLSPAGRAILERHHFLPPETGKP